MYAGSLLGPAFLLVTFRQELWAQKLGPHAIQDEDATRALTIEDPAWGLDDLDIAGP